MTILRMPFLHGSQDLDFNFHSMLAPDLLHEFELGVWKAVFTHLVRMVYSIGASAIQTLDQR